MGSSVEASISTHEQVRALVVGLESLTVYKICTSVQILQRWCIQEVHSGYVQVPKPGVLKISVCI